MWIVLYPRNGKGAAVLCHQAVWFCGRIWLENFRLSNPLQKRHCCVYWEKEISYCTFLLFMNNNKKPWRRKILSLLSCWELDQVLVLPKPPLCSFSKCRSLQMCVFYSCSCEGLFTLPERYKRFPAAKMVIISQKAVLSVLCTCPVCSGLQELSLGKTWLYGNINSILNLSRKNSVLLYSTKNMAQPNTPKPPGRLVPHFNAHPFLLKGFSSP